MLDFKSIRRTGKDTADFMGYTVCRNGDIISPYGKVLNPLTYTYRKSHVTLYMGGVPVKINRGTLIWACFSDTVPDWNREIIRFRDGNTENAAFDNLYLISKKDYFHDRKESCKKLTQEERELIRDAHEKGMPLREIARKYNRSLMTVQRVVHDENNKED